MMLNIRKGNTYAWLIALSFISIIFIGYYVMIKPLSIVYDLANNDPDLPSRAKDLLPFVRDAWLWGAIILAVSLIIWAIIASFKRDYQQFQV